MQSGEVASCSDEFKSLMSVPTPGALQLKKHLTQGSQSGTQPALFGKLGYIKDTFDYSVVNSVICLTHTATKKSYLASSVSKETLGAPLQSISASDLLKQQKRKQRELLESRRKRVEEVQRRSLQNSGGATGQDCLMSPKAASEVPTASQSPAAPHTPTLGRGFSKGDDILFFDASPPPAPSPSTLNLSAAKLAALKKLRAKDTGLVKEDPNAVKRKRSDSSEINARVERNRTSPSGRHFSFFQCNSYI